MSHDHLIVSVNMWRLISFEWCWDTLRALGMCSLLTSQVTSAPMVSACTVMLGPSASSPVWPGGRVVVCRMWGRVLLLIAISLASPVLVIRRWHHWAGSSQNGYGGWNASMWSEWRSHEALSGCWCPRQTLTWSDFAFRSLMSSVHMESFRIMW